MHQDKHEKDFDLRTDENQIDSLVEFDLTIDNERVRGLSAEVRQRSGTDFQRHRLEVGHVIGYDGPWNYEEFREFCGRYYRDVIGSSGLDGVINRGERNLIERVAIRLYRRDEINLPFSGPEFAARFAISSKFRGQRSAESTPLKTC